MQEQRKIRKNFRGEGKIPSEGEGYKRIYRTPRGLFPKMTDAATSLGVAKSNLHRRFVSPKTVHRGYYVIENPTEEQEQEAVSNMLDTLLTKQKEEDHCDLCNAVDDMIFAEGCWLLGADHKHHSTCTKDVKIHYTFCRKDYRVTYTGWEAGERPHLTK